MLRPLPVVLLRRTLSPTMRRSTSLRYSLTRGVITPTRIPFHNANIGHDDKPRRRGRSRNGWRDARAAPSRSLEPSHSYPEQDATGLNQPAQGPAASSRATAGGRSFGKSPTEAADRARSHRLRLSCRITPGRTRHPIRSRQALPIRGVPILDPMRIHRGGRTKRSPTFGASTSDVVQEDHGALSTQRGIEATRTPKRIGA